MYNILLSHLLCAASSFLPFFTVIGQVSEPYSSLLSTTASYSRILVLFPQLLLFYIFSSLPNAVFAFGSFHASSTNDPRVTISENYKIWRNCCPNTFVEEYKILA